MFAEVGLHLENRITVCPTVPAGPSDRVGNSPAAEEGARGDGVRGTMKLRCTCTPRAQVAFQVRLPSRWSRRVVTMRRRDCKIDGARNPFSHYAVPFYSCSPVERFGNTAADRCTFEVYRRRCVSRDREFTVKWKNICRIYEDIFVVNMIDLMNTIFLWRSLRSLLVLIYSHIIQFSLYAIMREIKIIYFFCSLSKVTKFRVNE